MKYMRLNSTILFVFLLSYLAISCEEKPNYDSVLCKIMTNETNYLNIKYNNEINQIEFLYEGKTILGNISGNTVTFNNDRFSKKNSIKITENDLLINLSINNEDYLVCGTSKKSKDKFDTLENRLNKVLLKKRIDVDSIKLSNYLFEYSKINSLETIESGAIKNKQSSIKDGDIVHVFENYSDNIKKIRSTVYPNKLYEGYFTTILEQKKPFLVCMTINDGVSSGNKFNDVGFSKSQIGEMYHYANYRDEIKIKDYHFFYYDPYSSNIECSYYGYRIVFEKTTKGNWIVSKEGYYSFISNKWLDELIFSNYIKTNIIHNINQNCKKIGVIENGFPNYKKDNYKIINNFFSNVFADEIEEQFDAKTEKKLKEGKGIKIGKTVISW
jgi:hypothetical protein